MLCKLILCDLIVIIYCFAKYEHFFPRTKSIIYCYLSCEIYEDHFFAGHRLSDEKMVYYLFWTTCRGGKKHE